ncbi:type I-C CRISPR-associated protein Cas7/Csd2 [Alkanindiges illinoisensis]|uniref:Type I-C CRISPR-associated protein Cas7/Csd2 n=2 Tax=Alkanindiges illinoisensis TaxID=197183 RepID=A0A4Y7XEW1_9GAMM|nr:type I-C CRISPR-associated protein Cas7/Csd2 [Alkanindiges illinoisensis]
MTAITNRYDFVLLFDVTNGNPNGDPDAGNMARLDPETNQGLVTDVCIKRKVRNFVELTQDDQQGYAIYMQEKAVLNNFNKKAYEALGLEPDTKTKKLPKDADKAKALTKFMCDHFFDVRTFGAVMTTEVNTGQVRGAVQLAFARSIDPIVPLEISITRMAVTNEKDADKERTMGRKHIIPYGLYEMHGFISAPLAERTGFSENDLEIFWQALEQMFEHDRSAARGEMTTRKLVIFKHESKLGNAPAHQLFERVKVERKEGVESTRAYTDYNITVDHAGKPEGVEIIERL